MNDEQTAGDDEPQARVVDLAPSATAAVRVSRPFETLDVGALFDLHIPNIADRVADLGGEVVGAPYARYHEYGPERADIELGMPVAAPVANLRPLAECIEGEIGNGVLPGGPTAVTVHRGPYSGLSDTYTRLRRWIAGQGRRDGAGPWESYIDDPSEVSNSEELRTEVFWPLSDQV